MTRKCMDALAALLIATVTLIVPLSGCASLPFSNMRSPMRSRSAPPSHPRPELTRESEESEQAILGAVSDFLERTKVYQLPKSTSSSVPAATPPPAVLSAPVAPARLVMSEGSPSLTQSGPNFPIQRDLALANTHMTLQTARPMGAAPALPVIESVSIRGVAQHEPSVASVVQTKTTNQPLDTRSAQDSVTIDQVISNLKTRAAKTSDFDTEWRLRLIQLAFHRDAEAMKVSRSLSPQAQNLLEALVRTAVAVRRVVRDPLLVGERELNRVKELQELLARRIDLVVTSVALCRKVVTFGVYEELADEALVAGRTTWAIVYSEIRNFQVEQTDDGEYRTHLATRLEVLTEAGQSVWQHQEPDIADLCRQRRTDFFIAQRIELPPTLPAGNYVLKVMVEDKLSDKAGETSHPFVLNSAMAVSMGH